MVDKCCMCKRNEESVDHLLVHYEVVYALWNAIFRHFRLSWMMPQRVVDLFTCWWTGGHSWSTVMWKIVPYCLLWCLWREQNNRNFKDQELKIFYSLYTWIAAYLAPLVISFNDFLILFSFSN
jgi:hypothetical protein